MNPTHQLEVTFQEDIRVGDSELCCMLAAIKQGDDVWSFESPSYDPKDNDEKGIALGITRNAVAGAMMFRIWPQYCTFPFMLHTVPPDKTRELAKARELIGRIQRKAQDISNFREIMDRDMKDADGPEIDWMNIEYWQEVESDGMLIDNWVRIFHRDTAK